MLIGIDILNTKKIKIIECKDSILCRLFTPMELESIKGLNYNKRIITLASIFASKEAVVKTLGTGFDDNIGSQDIQIIIDEFGKGTVHLLSEAKYFADELGIRDIQLALAAEKEVVIAMVVMVR